MPGEQEDRRIEHVIPVEAVKAGWYTVIIETTCNSMFGLGPYRYQTPDVRALLDGDRKQALTCSPTGPSH
jgi:alpha-mannosidase